MSNRRTNREDVYEAYIDASVALFMQYYCDMLDECVIKNDDLLADGERTAFPERLDIRCRSLIKQTMKQKKIRQAMRYTGKAFRTVCRVAVACLTIISLLFISVEAVRIPIINYYIDLRENNFLEIGANENGKDAMTESFDPADPLADILTDEYQLQTHDVISEVNFAATYAGTDNSQVFIKARPITGTTGVDLEDADNVQQFHIVNCDAFLIEEDNRTRIVWIHEEKAATFTLIVIGRSDLDLVSIAGQIIRKIS